MDNGIPELLSKPSAQLGIAPDLLVPISMPESQESLLFTHFLFPDLYLPAFISLILCLLTLLTSIHNKNVSFSGKEKPFGVAAD